MIPGFDDLTYYEVLDISIGVDNKEIQEAYYRVRAAFSKNSLASYSLYDQDEREQILRLIEEAYHTLIDENSRQEYDQKLSKEKTRLAKEKKALQEVLPLMPGRDESEPEVKPFDLTETETNGLSMDLAADAPEADGEAAEPPLPEEPSENVIAEAQPREEMSAEAIGTDAAPFSEPPAEPDLEPEPPPAGADEQTDEAPVVSSAEEAEAEAEPTEPEPEAAASEEPSVEEPAAVKAAPAVEPEETADAEPPATTASPEPETDAEPQAAEAEPAEPTPSETETPSPLNRPVSIRDVQNARERAQASQSSETGEEAPIRIQGRLIRAGDPPERPPIIKPPARPERPARPADEQTQWSSKGQEPFEETVYDLPEVKKSPSPLDFLGASYSGAFLKQVREQKGLSIDKAWEVTRIRKSILQAMEDENYKALPADVFLRGMLIIYSRFLEIENPEGVAKGYMERLVASRDWMD